MPWILEHPCDSWLWAVPKIQTRAAQLRTALGPGRLLHLWLTVRKANAEILVERVGMGILLTLRQFQNQFYTAVVGSGASCVFEAGSARKDGSSDVCYVGDTRQPLSVKNDDIILHSSSLPNRVTSQHELQSSKFLVLKF